MFKKPTYVKNTPVPSFMVENRDSKSDLQSCIRLFEPLVLYSNNLSEEQNKIKNDLKDKMEEAKKLLSYSYFPNKQSTPEHRKAARQQLINEFRAIFATLVRDHNAEYKTDYYKKAETIAKKDIRGFEEQEKKSKQYDKERKYDEFLGHERESPRNRVGGGGES